MPIKSSNHVRQYSCGHCLRPLLKSSDTSYKALTCDTCGTVTAFTGLSVGFLRVTLPEAHQGQQCDHNTLGKMLGSAEPCPLPPGLSRRRNSY